jgi:predicted TIM-barrel fold metal-dependent hydrolase
VVTLSAPAAAPYGIVGIDGIDGIVDAHVHIGRHFAPTRTGDSVVDLVAAGREAGVARAVVSSLGDRALLARPTPEEIAAANAHVSESVDRFPDFFAGLVFVTPDYVDASLEQMARHIGSGPFVGIKLWTAARVTDPRLAPLLDYASELGVVVLQHSWDRDHPVPGETTPADVAEAAGRHPDVTFQMAHLIGAREHGVRVVADHPNVVVDTCGGNPERQLVCYALEHLGPERILFGSDAPIRDVATSLTKVTGDVTDAATRELLLGGNARRVYRRLAADVAR